MPEEKLIAEKSHIRCKIIIEILGKPREHVEQALSAYIEKIRADSGLIVLNTSIADAKEKEELWSTFAELEMVVKGIPKLIAFCFDYMPSSIEILKPDEYLIRKSTIEDFINDLQARLHNVDMVVKTLKNENLFLRKNLNKALTNTIQISLVPGNLDKEKLSKITGIKADELQIFLDSLVKENKIREESGVYKLVNAKGGENAKK
jgi:hypothetical protein